VRRRLETDTKLFTAETAEFAERRKDIWSAHNAT